MPEELLIVQLQKAYQKSQFNPKLVDNKIKEITERLFELIESNHRSIIIFTIFSVGDIKLSKDEIDKVVKYFMDNGVTVSKIAGTSNDYQFSGWS